MMFDSLLNMCFFVFYAIAREYLLRQTIAVLNFICQYCEVLSKRYIIQSKFLINLCFIQLGCTIVELRYPADSDFFVMSRTCQETYWQNVY